VDGVRVFDQPKDPEALEGYYTLNLAFADETTLYTAGANGLLLWNIESGTFERIQRAPPGGALNLRMTPDRQSLLVVEQGPTGFRQGPMKLYDLRTGQVESVSIPDSGVGFSPPALNSDGTIWADGGEDGIIRVGRTNGGEPHLLIGHDGEAWASAISLDNKWVATGGIIDSTLRLWPMPDLDKPPLHTLPHEELIAKLKTLTNLRAVRDEESSTGWKIEVGPFPGWAEVPTL
jgi:WD40 repeat protein